MASGAEHERNENYTHASVRVSIVPRQHLIPTVSVTLATRIVGADSRQVVVHALFEYACESGLCTKNTGYIVLWHGGDKCHSEGRVPRLVRGSEVRGLR